MNTIIETSPRSAIIYHGAEELQVEDQTESSLTKISDEVLVTPDSQILDPIKNLARNYYTDLIKPYYGEKAPEIIERALSRTRFVRQIPEEILEYSELEFTSVSGLYDPISDETYVVHNPEEPHSAELLAHRTIHEIGHAIGYRSLRLRQQPDEIKFNYASGITRLTGSLDDSRFNLLEESLVRSDTVRAVFGGELIYSDRFPQLSVWLNEANAIRNKYNSRYQEYVGSNISLISVLSALNPEHLERAMREFQLPVTVMSHQIFEGLARIIGTLHETDANDDESKINIGINILNLSRFGHQNTSLRLISQILGPELAKDFPKLEYTAYSKDMHLAILRYLHEVMASI